MLIKFLIALMGLFIAFAGFAMEEKKRKVSFGENKTIKIEKTDKKIEKKSTKSNSSIPDEEKLHLVGDISWEEFQKVLKEWDRFQKVLKKNKGTIPKGDNLKKYDGTVLEHILTNWRDGVNNWCEGIHWYHIKSEKLLCRMVNIQHLFKREKLKIVLSIDDEKKILSKFLTGRYSFIFDEKNFEEERKTINFF
jgi:hypothetical protein